ncbi:YheC/YheD family endospore coat-associated protein [Bacillus sp. AK128]
MRLSIKEGHWVIDQNKPVTWGKQSKLIPYSSSLLSPNIKLTNVSSLKPLVGILAGDSQNKHFSGNEKAFQRIQLALQHKGGLAYVFTPAGWDQNQINGFIYDFKNGTWVKACFPHPDVVYNRIPFRKLEQKKAFLQIQIECKQMQIPFFNQSFLQKDHIFNWLSKNDRLLPHLPVTKKLMDLESFEKMVNQFRKVYVKPSKGKKGKGIVVIEKDHHHLWSVHSIKESVTELPKQELIESWILPKLKNDYIVQEAIEPLSWNGARFDYRVLVHRKDDKQFIISGIGVRQSEQQQITTHLPAGGKIIPFQELPFPEDESVIKKLVDEIGPTLKQYQGYIGEFSIDIGKSRNGNLYIFEVNSKPMVFDEDDIRREGLENLLQYFSYLTI